MNIQTLSTRTARRCTTLLATIIAGSALSPTPAQAIPAFARKYETSCETCHTVYPRLTPFGEAFRRNGYRFPGVDSDMAKQPTVAMGNEAYKDVFPNAVWPDWIANSFPFSFGVNGAATLHPSSNSSAGRADNGTLFDMSGLIGEGHIWGGGSFDDSITYFAEVTFADGGAEIEHAKVLFNDLIGPKHAFNLQLGRSYQTLTSFGVHSSYASDTRMLPVMVPNLYGATSDNWNTAGLYNGFEVTGVVGGRFDYSLGLNAGSNIDVRATENFYVHAGCKLGGLSLDGEEKAEDADPAKPWAENALTVDVFAVHSNTRFTAASGDPQQNTALTLGAGLRGQMGSLELDVGGYYQKDNHALQDGSEASTFVQFDELSYIVFPWLVPVLRFEYVSVKGTGSSNGQMNVGYNNWKLMPAVAALIRPNIKLMLIGTIESATGVPEGSWDAVGGVAALDPAVEGLDPAKDKVSAEIESIMLQFAFAF